MALDTNAHTAMQNMKSHKTSNNRVQRTRHKVSGPLTRDVRKRYEN